LYILFKWFPLYNCTLFCKYILAALYKLGYWRWMLSYNLNILFKWSTKILLTISGKVLSSSRLLLHHRLAISMMFLLEEAANLPCLSIPPKMMFLLQPKRSLSVKQRKYHPRNRRFANKMKEMVPSDLMTSLSKIINLNHLMNCQ